jgi:hypothetical protein
MEHRSTERNRNTPGHQLAILQGIRATKKKNGETLADRKAKNSLRQHLIEQRDAEGEE